MTHTHRAPLSHDQEATYRAWANVPAAAPTQLKLSSTDPNAWSWGWNAPGLHYGPIPVGFLFLLAWWLLYRH